MWNILDPKILKNILPELGPLHFFLVQKYDRNIFSSQSEILIKKKL